MVSEARKQSIARMETDYSKHAYFRVSTRSHGSEGGRARERAWELVDFWSTTCCPIKGEKIHSSSIECALAQLVGGR